MCMFISKEHLFEINEGFGGSLRDDSDLETAIYVQSNNKIGIYKKLAYLIRAISVYHPYFDGNKRVALYVCCVFSEKYHKQIDGDLLVYQLVSIAKKEIEDLRNIEWRLKNAIR